MRLDEALALYAKAKTLHKYGVETSKNAELAAEIGRADLYCYLVAFVNDVYETMSEIEQAFIDDDCSKGAE